MVHSHSSPRHLSLGGDESEVYNANNNYIPKVKEMTEEEKVFQNQMRMKYNNFIKGDLPRTVNDETQEVQVLPHPRDTLSFWGGGGTLANAFGGEHAHLYRRIADGNNNNMKTDNEHDAPIPNKNIKHVNEEKKGLSLLREQILELLSSNFPNHHKNYNDKDIESRTQSDLNDQMNQILVNNYIEQRDSPDGLTADDIEFFKEAFAKNKVVFPPPQHGDFTLPNNLSPNGQHFIVGANGLLDKFFPNSPNKGNRDNDGIGGFMITPNGKFFDIMEFVYKGITLDTLYYYCGLLTELLVLLLLLLLYVEQSRFSSAKFNWSV